MDIGVLLSELVGSTSLKPGVFSAVFNDGAEIMKSCFIVEKDLVKKRVIPFYTRLTIGRQSANDIVLPDPTVSKRHAIVGRVKGQTVVKDLGSRNGTFVNGDKVEKSILLSGDRLKVGSVNLRFFREEGSDSKAANNDKDSQGWQKLGDYLLEAGLVDKFTLLRVLAQEDESLSIDQVLIGTGVLDDESIARSLAKQMKLSFIVLPQIEIPQEVISLVPVGVAKTHLLVPAKLSEGKLLVAMVDPLDAEAIQVLRMTTNHRIEVAVAPRGDILQALVKYYPSEFLEQMLDGAPDEDEITVDY